MSAFFKNIKDAVLKNKTSSLILLTYFASIASITSLILGVFGKLNNEGIIGIIFIGIIAIITLIDNIYQRLKNKKQIFQYFNNITQRYFLIERKARYAETLSLLNDGFAEIHKQFRFEDLKHDGLSNSNISVNLPHLTKNTAQSILTSLCTKLSTTFKTITGYNCPVCIKIYKGNKVSSKNKNLLVYTLVRDSESSSKRSASDINQDIKHLINENTDFSYIFRNYKKPNGKIFFCNDLVKIENYKNTSFKAYGNPPTLEYEKRLQKWTLPYKSTIVVPILPNHPLDHINCPILAYLCVDCEKRDIFAKEFDVDLMCGVADGLYNLMKIYPLLPQEN
jgi:hypothetical protein